MAPEWISIKCALGVCVYVCKSRGKKKNGRGAGSIAAVSGSPGRGGGAVASEVAYQQCAQARGRVTECVRRSGRGWEASFKARCSSGEGGLFYNHLLFGIFFFFFLIFFFSRGNNLKKKKKRQQTPDRQPWERKEVGRGKARRGGGRRDRQLEGRREAGVPGAARPRGRGEGREGEAPPAALPCPSRPRARLCPASGQVPGPRPLHPVLLLPPPPRGRGEEGGGRGGGGLRVFGGGCCRFLKESGKLCLLLFLY